MILQKIHNINVNKRFGRKIHVLNCSKFFKDFSILNNFCHFLTTRETDGIPLQTLSCVNDKKQLCWVLFLLAKGTCL